MESKYCIAETVEDSSGDKYYSVVPAHWTIKFGVDKGIECYKGLSGRDVFYYGDSRKMRVDSLLKKAMKDPMTPFDEKLLQKYRCRIVDGEFESYEKASAAVTILESTDTDDEATAMTKIANLTINNLTASFDNDFNDTTPVNSTIFNSTVFENNRRFTRQQQFYQDAGVNPSSSQQRSFVNTDAPESIAAEEIVELNEITQSLDQICAPSSSQPQAVTITTMNVPNLHLSQNQITPGPSHSQSQVGVMNVSPLPIDSRPIIVDSVINDISQYEMDTDNQLQDTELTLVKTNSLGQLFQLVQQLQQKQEVFQAAVIAELGSLHAKMDEIANRCVVSEDLFSPVNSAEKLSDLEEKAKDPVFFRNVVLRLGNTVGKGTPGGTAALLLIHKFFDRNFLLSCSWSGRARGESKTKVAIIHHETVLNLFVETVQFCDPNFSEVQCNAFLKIRLKNAKQNCSLKNERSTASRPNRKRKIDGSAAADELNFAETETCDQKDDYDDNKHIEEDNGNADDLSGGDRADETVAEDNVNNKTND